jgi:alcohol dehydrogenase
VMRGCDQSQQLAPHRGLAHILKGDVPSVAAGRILGHEGIGLVEQVGTAVTGMQVGDRVLVSWPMSACMASRSHCISSGCGIPISR